MKLSSAEYWGDHLRALLFLQGSCGGMQTSEIAVESMGELTLEELDTVRAAAPRGLEGIAVFSYIVSVAAANLGSYPTEE